MWIGNEATAMKPLPIPEQIREERSVLRVEGPEAKLFLQGILTCDVEAVSADSAGYGALLTPQGKILFDVFIYESPNGLFIDCATSQMAELLKRLNMYRLRAKVTISAADELAIAVSQDVRPGAWRDPRSALMGWRRLVPTGELPQSDGYHLYRISAGLADTDMDLGSGEFFPHEANFDQIGAVSFSKGCYIGQEVVSRMEHRGTARARILPVQCDSNAPPRGCDIRADDKSIGTMLGSEGDIGLALIRLDRLAEVRAPLLSEGVRIRVQKPAFARYDVPGVKD
jgi:folate-binding protein YgfZ